MSEYIFQSIDISHRYILNVFNNPFNVNLNFTPFDNIFYKVDKDTYFNFKKTYNSFITEYQIQQYSNINDLQMNLYHYYNYFYLKALWILIKELKLNYFFASITDDKFKHIDINNEIFLEPNNNNPYLQEHTNKLQKLSNDILDRGMLFPFFVGEKENHYLNMLGGIHRFCALAHNTKAKNKKFLFINIEPLSTITKQQMPILLKYNLVNNTIFTNEHSIQLFNDNQCFYIKTKNIQLFHILFKIMTEKLVLYSAQYPNIIQPNKILNNESLWEHFIIKPFQYDTFLEESMQ